MHEVPIPIAGGSRLTEFLRGWMKAHSPALLRAWIRTSLAPVRRLRRYVVLQRRIRRALPPTLRRPFRQMHAVAHANWHAGTTIPSGELVELPLGHGGRSVWLRPGTSDVLVYSDVVVNEQYGRMAVEDVSAIVDCGANIGLTSAYLLNRFDRATVVAIEPDPVNYELCKKNLAQFGSRAIVLRAALWGNLSRMRVSAPDLVGSWASTVAPIAADGEEEGIDGINLNTLFSRYHLDRVDLLKIDIEGAEYDVFANGDLGWLDKVRCIQVELESPEAEIAFFRAVEGRGFALTRSLDVVIATRQAR
jgi:FkbM family methyltransferase